SSCVAARSAWRAPGPQTIPSTRPPGAARAASSSATRSRRRRCRWPVRDCSYSDAVRLKCVFNARSSVFGDDELERPFEPEARRILLEPLRRRLAERPACCDDAENRARELVRLGARGNRAVDAVRNQLDRGILRSVDDDAGRAARRRLDDDEAVALALRSRGEARRARKR